MKKLNVATNQIQHELLSGEYSFKQIANRNNVTVEEVDHIWGTLMGNAISEDISENNDKKNLPTWVNFILGFVLGYVIIGGIVGGESSDSRKQKEEQASAERAERKKNGFHCLSSWDGSNRDVEKTIKNRLRDPDSYQHIETRITPVNEYGKHELVTSYRAKNAFGGYVTGVALAVVENDSCKATVMLQE